MNDFYNMGNRNISGGTEGGGYQPMPSALLQANTQKEMANQQAALQRELAQLQRDTAREALGPQNRALDLQQQQFEFKKGMLGNYLNQVGSLMSGQQKNAPAIAKGPAIEVAPIFSPEEMAMQQNQVRDRSMRQAAGVTNRMESKFAGRGLGGNSPLLDRMRMMSEVQGRVGGEGAALDFSRQMATENAKNMLAGQQLRQEVEDSYSKNLLSRYGIQQQGQNQFLAMLGSMFGGHHRERGA